MALSPCRECQAQISSSAPVCPHCGIERPIAVTSPPMRLITKVALAVLGALILLMCVYPHGPGSVSSSPSPVVMVASPEEIADKKKSDAVEAAYHLSLAHALTGAKMLKQAMRDPESFKLESVLVMDGGTICYDYRARNGFNGFNQEHAVLAHDGKTFLASTQQGFHNVWNKECANKRGYEEVETIAARM